MSSELQTKCLDKRTILFRSVLLLCLVFFAVPAKAMYDYSSSKYWKALEPKVEAYLKKELDANKYAYEIVGPSADLIDYIGGSAEAEIEIGRFNPNSRSHQKTLVISALKSEEENRNAKLGNYARTINDNITVVIKVWKLVDGWVLNEAVKRNQELKDKFKKEKLKVKPIEERLLLTVDEGPNQIIEEHLATKTAIRDLDAGTALKINMIKSTKLVSVGDSVEVVSETDTIKLVFKCKALGSGDVGDSINLSCPDFEKRSTKATVTGYKKARLN